jgi:hypothetical protein
MLFVLGSINGLRTVIQEDYRLFCVENKETRIYLKERTFLSVLGPINNLED